VLVAVVVEQAENGIKPAKHQRPTSNDELAICVLGIFLQHKTKKNDGSTEEDSNALRETIYAGLSEWLQVICWQPYIILSYLNGCR